MPQCSRYAYAALVTLSCASLFAQERKPVEREANGLPRAFPEDFSDPEKGLARFELTDAKAWEMKQEKGAAALALVRQSNYKPAVRSPVNIAWVKDLKVGVPFVMDVRLRSTKPDYDHRDLCLFFGGVDASHFFYVHIAKRADPNANNIFLVDGEPRKNVATRTTDGTNWDDDWHTVRVARDKAGKTEVFFDGTSIMTADKANFPEGRVGVGSFDDTGDFREITVWAAPAAAAAK
jgi:hypothetical protein